MADYKTLDKKHGVAGLNVLLSVIAMLFMIGLIVMVFVIAGARLQTAVEDDSTEAALVINDTYQSLDDVTDWFPTIVVLTAMVVLILLVVIIINSIKGSGITGGA